MRARRYRRASCTIGSGRRSKTLPSSIDEACDAATDEVADERALVGARAAAQAHAGHAQHLVALQQLGHVARLARVRPPHLAAELIPARQDLRLAAAQRREAQRGADRHRRLGGEPGLLDTASSVCAGTPPDGPYRFDRADITFRLLRKRLTSRPLWQRAPDRSMLRIMLLSDSPLQQAARDHLLLHFSRNGSPDPLLVLERGEGPYVFDTRGQPLPRRPVQPLLRPARLLLRRGDGQRRGGAAAAARVLHGVGRGASRRPSSWPRRSPELMPGDLDHVFFTSGGSESVESAWKLVRQYHVANGEPQRTKAIARDSRLPRRDARAPCPSPASRR